MYDLLAVTLVLLVLRDDCWFKGSLQFLRMVLFACFELLFG